jgi:surface antigen
VKQFKKVRSYFKKTFSKKKNQRRATYTLCIAVIAALTAGIFVRDSAAKQTEIQYQAQIESKAQEVQQKQMDFQAQQVETVQLEKAKEETEEQLKKKLEREAELQRQVERLNKEKADLQAAKDAQASQLAVATAPFGRGGDVSGNGYERGYCTWYVKNKRSDIPNTWGNAHTWAQRAEAGGWTVSSKPKVGAIGANASGNYGHVVYVESVNKDGTIGISEMNAVGWNVVSYRTASVSEFTYIY